jgi:hypothetical protein
MNRSVLRRHRIAAERISRKLGCSCTPKLVLSPLTGAAVWCRRPDTGHPVYIVKHTPPCPLLALVNPDEWLIVDEPKRCEQ